jgi:hypothetical protein
MGFERARMSGNVQQSVQVRQCYTRSPKIFRRFA